MKVTPHHSTNVPNKRLSDQRHISASAGTTGHKCSSAMMATRFGGIGSPGNESAHQMQALVTDSRNDNAISSMVSRMPAWRLSVNETARGAELSGRASATDTANSPVCGAHISSCIRRRYRPAIIKAATQESNTDTISTRYSLPAYGVTALSLV